jgi:hypothetical protein
VIGDSSDATSVAPGTPLTIAPAKRVYALLTALFIPVWALLLLNRHAANSMLMLGVSVVLAALLLAYERNKTVTLSSNGLRQGFSLFQTTIPLGQIASIRRETVMARGAAAPVIVIASADGATTITLPARAFERSDLSRLVAAIRAAAPSARVEMPSRE